MYKEIQFLFGFVVFSGIFALDVQQFNGTVYDFLHTNESFGVLHDVMNRTQLLDQLNETQVTLFAPNDAAVNSLPTWAVKGFQDIRESSFMQTMLLYHLNPNASFTPDNFSSSEGGGQPISIPTFIETLNLTAYQLIGAAEGGGGGGGSSNSYVNDAKILSVSNASNGYIFEVNRVLTPMYHLNSSVYNVTQVPPLPENYTFPSEPAPLYNLSSFNPSN